MNLRPNSPQQPRYNIRRIAARLKQDSPVRQWMGTQHGSEKASASDLLHALTWTERCGWQDRAVAFHILGTLELDPQEREQAAYLLTEAFKQPDIERVSLGRFGGAMAIVSAFWYCLSIAVDWFFFGRISLPSRAGVLCAGLLTTPFPLVLQERYWRIITKRIAATALTTAGDPLSILPLYYEVSVSGAAHPEARQALKAILPTVTHAWYGYLAAGSALVDLAWSADQDLALAALTALEQAGSGNNVKAVERLADRAGATRVRERAAEILPTLLARREQERAASTLLRASAPNRTDDLVRPVYGSDPEVNNLLRASHNVELHE